MRCLRVRNIGSCILCNRTGNAKMIRVLLRCLRFVLSQNGLYMLLDDCDLLRGWKAQFVFGCHAGCPDAPQHDVCFVWTLRLMWLPNVRWFWWCVVQRAVPRTVVLFLRLCQSGLNSGLVSRQGSGLCAFGYSYMGTYNCNYNQLCWSGARRVLRRTRRKPMVITPKNRIFFFSLL